MQFAQPTAQTLTRTQIYLTQVQQTRLNSASRRAAVTKSELIRQAIDQFLATQTPVAAVDNADQLQAIAGLWSQRDDLVDPSAYVRQLRAPRFG